MKKGKRSGKEPLPEPPESLRQALVQALAPFGPLPPRSHALPILQAAQVAAGWLSPEVLAFVSRRTRLPVADLTGLATFYELLATEPQGQVVVRVCDDVVCSRHGAAQALLQAVSAHLGVEPGGTTADGRFTLHTAACLGGCDRGPCALVEGVFVGNVVPEQVGQLLETPAAPAAHSPAPAAHHGWLPGHTPALLGRCGRVDPASLNDYAAHGGLIGLRRALSQPPAEAVATVTASGLLGRGGAAFPTGVKWAGVRQAGGGPKYVVLNADESEPGTFTNRKLLEEDPFLVLEGMLIAGWAVGATHGFAYIRGEYECAARRFAAALAAARGTGMLGPDVLGSGWSFDVEIRLGAGAYVCGEETALFASIEGYRGEPRNKPPFPITHGLFGKPTAINNAETLACVPHIFTAGPAAFAAAPPKLFAVSGDVLRPGVYEAPLGTPLRRLVAECGGGFAGEPQAVLMGGAAGFWLRPDQLDVQLDLSSLRSVGAALGSGAIMVFDRRVDLWQAAERLARFFATESCGKCVPCRLGTLRQWELVQDLRRRGEAGADHPSVDAAGSPAAPHVALLNDLATAMGDASICGLGQAASWPIQSLIRQFGLPREVPAGG